MNRIIKEALVKCYHYVSHQKFKEHFDHFLKAYNFAKRLKILGGLPPFEKIIKFWKLNYRNLLKIHIITLEDLTLRIILSV